jgi:hypothetical protein
VLSRPRSAQEDARVREILPRLAEIMTARLKRHEWFGRCIAVTMMVSRMLDRVGIWNCVFHGSAAIANLKSGEKRHFAIVDEHEGEGYERGHMWLAVPPFAVVDMTLRFQRWERDPFQEAIAPALLIETPRVVRARAEDVVTPAVRQACAAHTGRHDPNLHIRLFPDQERISRIVPARRHWVFTMWDEISKAKRVRIGGNLCARSGPETRHSAMLRRVQYLARGRWRRRDRTPSAGHRINACIPLGIALVHVLKHRRAFLPIEFRCVSAR